MTPTIIWGPEEEERFRTALLIGLEAPPAQPDNQQTILSAVDEETSGLEEISSSYREMGRTVQDEIPFNLRPEDPTDRITDRSAGRQVPSGIQDGADGGTFSESPPPDRRDRRASPRPRTDSPLREVPERVHQEGDDTN